MGVTIRQKWGGAHVDVRATWVHCTELNMPSEHGQLSVPISRTLLVYLIVVWVKRLPLLLRT